MIKRILDETTLLVGTFADTIVALGISLILLASSWDILLYGARGFFEYSICWKGVLAIWCGAIMILSAWKVERSFR